jgi:hypothetical protein
VPLLITVAEDDPEFTQRHAVSLFSQRLDAKQSLPKFCRIRGHNHFSTLLHLNSPDTSLGDALLSFIGELIEVAARLTKPTNCNRKPITCWGS